MFQSAFEWHKFKYLRKVDQKKLAQAVEALKTGNFEKALKLFNVLIEDHSDDPDLYGYRGAVFLNLRKNQSALTDFNKAVSLDPEYSYRYSSRAFAKDAMGDLAGAISDYEKAVELDPDDAIAHNNLGLLIEKSGNQAAAQKHFSTADELADSFLGSRAENDGPKPEDGISMQPQKLQPEPKKVSQKMYWQQFTRVFSSQNEFRKFIRFIFNGFKSKDA